MKNTFKVSGVILLIILIQSCKEKPTPPVLSTTAVTVISYTTATSGGEVTNEGGDPVISRGICWNTSADPTISNSKTSESGGLGTFISNITPLTPNTTYYVRAYATNTAGTGYGDSKTFTTLQVAVPVLTTTAITAITQTSAVSGGNITDDKGGSVTARGICWGTATNPTTVNSKTTDATGSGIYTSSLTGLVGNTTYYVRAYATNSVGIAYGNEVSFNTSALLPTISTATTSSITSTTASSGGNITSNGGATVTSSGVCWSTTTNPTVSLTTKTIDGAATGAFISSISGLTPNTTYYVKAYATNNSGTAYGNEASFTSNPVLVTGITINLTTTTITKGSTKQLTASILPSNATNKNITWSSANNSIATVSATGLVSAVDLGSTTITVTTENGGFSASCTVNTVPYFSQIGVAYVAVDGLTVTLNSFIVTSTATTYKYAINYTLVNNTPDLAIDEGTFKMYYATKSGGLPQYGSFTKLFPGGTITRSYMFEELQSTPFGTLEYHHDNFFSTTPIVESLKWEVKIPVGQSPTVTTLDATSVTQTTASSGGNITSDGGATVTVRGVCWSNTSSSPTIANSKTADGIDSGIFTSSITGLTEGTTYYLRAYATNSGGTGYGNTISFTVPFAIIFNPNLTYGTVTDIDGNVYKTISIGTQTWMAENLKTTKFKDGTSIPLVTDKTAWLYLTTSGYCWYDNNEANYKATFGALYNGYTINTGKLCPTGWHVPSDVEWSYFGEGYGGGLKETGNTHWNSDISPNMGATNESGFTALAGGYRTDLGFFHYLGTSYGYWWSSTDYNTSTANNWARYMGTFYTWIHRDIYKEQYGMSVRCIKD